MKNPAIRFMAILTIIGLAVAACKLTATDSGIRYVAPKDGLNMRTEPSVTGKKMLTIPKGAQVQKFEEKPESFKIDNIEGKWTKISWQGKTGWVFGGFLTTAEPASSAARSSDASNAGSLKSHFESLYFIGPGATKEPGSSEIRGHSYECGGTIVTNVSLDENGLSYDLSDENCDRHGRGDCRNCRKENTRTCTVSASAILAANNGGRLDGGSCR